MVALMLLVIMWWSSVAYWGHEKGFVMVILMMARSKELPLSDLVMVFDWVPQLLMVLAMAGLKEMLFQ